MAPKRDATMSASTNSVGLQIDKSLKKSASSQIQNSRALRNPLTSNASKPTSTSRAAVVSKNKRSSRALKKSTTRTLKKYGTNVKNAGDGQSSLAIAQNGTLEDSDEIVNGDSIVPAESSPSPMGSYGGMGGMGMGGMGMGGMGMMGGMGGYGMGMGGMGMGMMGGMGMGPIFTLNQYLFGFQSLIFSLGQAINIVGMNTQALHHLYDQIMGMLDQGLTLLQDLKTLEKKEIQSLSEEEQMRRRRLKALRWSIMLGISYVAYSSVSKWLRRRKEYRRRKRITGVMGREGNNAQYPGSQNRSYLSSGNRLSNRYDGNGSMHNGHGYDRSGTYNQGYYPSNAGHNYSYGGGYNQY